MRRIEYRDYLDRVYGCWIGKCVGGTIGGPYEGADADLSLVFVKSGSCSPHHTDFASLNPAGMRRD